MRYQRTLAALVLTTAAIAVPCTAWWIAGSRTVERERTELLSGPALAAERTAARLAERVAGRLEAILITESRRPFYEYRNRYPDLSEDCACAPIIDSPLARGPDDRSIDTHFEIDRNSQVTLPTIPEEPDDSADPRYDAAKTRLAELNRARSELVRTVWENGTPPRPEFSRRALPSIPPAVPASTAGMPPSRSGTAFRYGDAVAYVDPFRWYTVNVGGRPALVAMRGVRAPEGSLLQGFVIATKAIESSLDPEDGAAHFGPVAVTADETGNVTGDAESVQPSGAGAARATAAGTVELDGTTWAVTMDASGSLAEAELSAAKLARDFRTLFFGGTGVAVLAAVFVVGLVAQTERLARERSRFAATAAHELRTPLAGMRVYGEMISEDLGDREKTRSYARQVASEADRLARVVSNVLEYTRFEGGTTKLSPCPGDLGACVREGVERLRPALELAGAAVELRVAEALPPVRFDKDAAQQILQNLLDNAERYGRDSRDRTIRVAVEPGPKGDVQVTVADRGPGIPERDLRRLFRPFTRGSDPDAPAGLGLGLALVGSLAKAQGATIRYQAEPRGGSIFRISFPV